MTTTNTVDPVAAAEATVRLADTFIADLPVEGRRLLRLAADLYKRAGRVAEADSCTFAAERVKRLCRTRHRAGVKA